MWAEHSTASLVQGGKGSLSRSSQSLAVPSSSWACCEGDLGHQEVVLALRNSLLLNEGTKEGRKWPKLKQSDQIVSK